MLEASSSENAIFRHLGVFAKFPTTCSIQFTGKDPQMQAGPDTVLHFFSFNFFKIYFSFLNIYRSIESNKTASSFHPRRSFWFVASYKGRYSVASNIIFIEKDLFAVNPERCFVESYLVKSPNYRNKVKIWKHFFSAPSMGQIGNPGKFYLYKLVNIWCWMSGACKYFFLVSLKFWSAGDDRC